MSNFCLSTTCTQTLESETKNTQAVRIAPGTVLGEYVIIRPLGRGGFGSIWLARSRHTGHDDRPVAIKVLHAELALSPHIVSRFEREARVISMIKHPNVVSLHAVGELADGRPYLVMEYLAGTSLYTVVKEHGPLAPKEALAVLEPLAGALAAAHAHGIIHRDIKASNVMLCNGDGHTRVVLLDFGVAKLLEDHGPRLTAPLAAVGSPHCMAPEQILGEDVDARTDVYGLGALAFFLLTGEPPFPGNRGEAMSKHLLDERPRPSERLDISPGFDDAVTRAMAREPVDRFAGPAEFVAAFGAALALDSHCPETRRSHLVQAVGLYVEVSIETGSSAAARLYDDAETILALAEDWLVPKGYSLVQEIGNSGLFVLPAPDTSRASRAWLDEIVKDAIALSRELARRPERHPGVSVELHLHRGEADMDGDTIAGGTLMEPSLWSTMEPLEPGVWISVDTARALAEAE